MTTPPNEIIDLTAVGIDLFTNDEGDFPLYITLIMAEETSDIVLGTVSRMKDLFDEYVDTNSELGFVVSLKTADALVNDEGVVHTIITPDTLALILDYGPTERLITLELGTSRDQFTLH